ncbi:hypothetical protein H9P43_000760 [Blastocladiella emersonii ATCC 22665]|nr:hypothetical protein H9P43_000760 [Blastocladiella emersonii ATCC 22665]
MALDAVLLTAYVALLVMAVVPIYIGARKSVDLIEVNAATGAPERRSQSSGVDKEVFSSSDAYWFPVTGSAVLFGLYLLFRFLDKDHVNTLLTVYFALLGLLAVASLFADAVSGIERALGLTHYDLALTKDVAGAKSAGKKAKAAASLFALRFTVLTVVTSAIAALLTAAYVLTKHWILNNLFGFAFSVSAIALMDLDSFKTGMILLAGLFAYDVFWVFGTDVMVSVAKSFDAPVKMLFPKGTGFTMLGLGDIVIPGIYIALALRYDYHNHLLKLQSAAAAATPAATKGKKAAAAAPVTVKYSTSFSTPYFTAGFIAYIAGLVTTVFVMHTFQAAQPALLYLSPACILSTLLTALVRGELGAVFGYSSDTDKDLKDTLLGVASESDASSDEEGEKVATATTTKSRKAPAAATKKPATAVTSGDETEDETRKNAAAGGKRKRLEAERFDFVEQAAQPVAKRVHSDADLTATANPAPLPAVPRSRDLASTGANDAPVAATTTASIVAATSSAPAAVAAAAAVSKGKAAKGKAAKAAKAAAAAAAPVVAAEPTPAPAPKAVAAAPKKAAEPTPAPAPAPAKETSPVRKPAPAAAPAPAFTPAPIPAPVAAANDDEFTVVSRRSRKNNKRAAAAAAVPASATSSARDASPSHARASGNGFGDLSRMVLPDLDDFE